MSTQIVERGTWHTDKKKENISRTERHTSAQVSVNEGKIGHHIEKGSSLSSTVTEQGVKKKHSLQTFAEGQVSRKF